MKHVRLMVPADPPPKSQPSPAHIESVMAAMAHEEVVWGILGVCKKHDVPATATDPEFIYGHVHACGNGNQDIVRGWPDITLLLHSQMVCVEVKTGCATKSKAQRAAATLLKQHGALCIIAHSVEDFEEWLAEQMVFYA